MKLKQRQRSEYKAYCKMLRYGARAENGYGIGVNPRKRRIQQLHSVMRQLKKNGMFLCEI